jgi:hypothetical protein
VERVTELFSGLAVVKVSWVEDREIPMVIRGAVSYLYDMGKDEVTRVPRAAGSDPGLTLLGICGDALSRYSAVNPGQPPEIIDGIYPRIRSLIMNERGTSVQCEMFGGIAGMWHGHALTFRYDHVGRFLPVP